ncbi:MAG: RAD55 family ATPase, partial [Halodesulfurarchaeum sp.]
MRRSTGCRGMDQLLSGGLPAGRLFVVSGPPGSGKTTFASQFITQGVKESRDCLYVTMHESREELVEDMRRFSFGFERAVTSERFKFLNLTG